MDLDALTIPSEKRFAEEPVTRRPERVGDALGPVSTDGLAR
jgi:hypothetical protein